MRSASLLLFCAGAALLALVTILLCRGTVVRFAESFYDIGIIHRPYMVSIEREGVHHCAGAVLDRRFVLTSAHCFRSVVNYSVRAGSDMVQQGGSQHAISQINIHPKYSPFEVAFDIALVEVTPQFVLSRNVYPVRLAEFGDPEPADYVAELYAWGHTKDPTERSRALRRVSVHILHRDVCAELDPDTPPATPLTMCASYRGGSSKAPHVGDPGAPLMVRGAAVGVTSWRLLVAPGAAPGPYALFVSVQALRPWIDKHTAARPALHSATVPSKQRPHEVNLTTTPQ